MPTSHSTTYLLTPLHTFAATDYKLAILRQIARFVNLNRDSSNRIKPKIPHFKVEFSKYEI